MTDTILMFYFFTVSIPAMAGLAAAYALAISTNKKQRIASTIMIMASATLFALLTHDTQMLR